MQENIYQENHRFFPDFGRVHIALRIFIVAQCIAIILTIGRNDSFDTQAWHDLVLMTTFAQSIGLLSIVVLRLIAKPIRVMPPITGSLFLVFMLLLATFLFCEGAILAMYELKIITQRWPDWHWPMIIRALVISSIIIVLALRFAAVQHQVQMDTEAKQQDRLQALQSRIRPHFLFNSMNSVASLIRSDPELAEKALQDLADVFRVLLADARKMVPITAESELARQYLDIEKLRLGDRLQIKWSAINVPRNALIPSLTLQPIVENAIYHGIEPSFVGGIVDIRMWSEQDQLCIMITNPIPEITSQATSRKGNQIAMNNVSERLNHLFEGRASLKHFERLGSYYVSIQVPIIRG